MVACKYCKSQCIKYGCQKNGQQRFKCKQCGKTQQQSYCKKAYSSDINNWIIGLVKESCGIRSMARLLKVAINTIMRRIRMLAAGIKKPPVILEQEKVEVDELKTYIGSKKSECWIAYALNRQSGKVVYVIGNRTKQKLGVLIITLLLSKTKGIYTDNLRVYRASIPKSIHYR